MSDMKGWRLVPEELTEEMKNAWIEEITFADGYRAMLAAAPAAPQASTTDAEPVGAAVAASTGATQAVFSPKKVPAGTNLYTASQAKAGTEELVEALKAIAEGYPVHGEHDRYIIVENPNFKPDDGSNPNICVDVAAIAKNIGRS